MNGFFELASTRRSIRKFEERDIPVEDLEYFIRAAVSAPSGCNSQCWRFVAVRDRAVIKQIGEAVIDKVDSLLKIKGEELSPDYLAAKKRTVSFFTKAPVIIAVFMTKAQYYDQIFISALKDQGYDDEGIMKLFANYDILSIGAAVQNMLLAIHEKGYGACWMNEPAVAGEEINRILAVPREDRFISLVPVGFPAYIPRDKKMKELTDVLSII